VTFKPSLESLEARDVPSANPLDALLGNAQGLIPISFNALTGPLSAPTVSNNQATIPVTEFIGVNPVGTVPLTLSASQGSGGAEILNLHLDPIHLDLLGLNVQTSAICLNLTAQQGSGNLLGNLLYDVAHALDPNTTNGNLGSVLNSPIQNALLDLELGALLDNAVGSATGPNSVSPTNQATGLPMGANDLVHLSLGPLHLNLLGLVANLDNCNNGPVTVDVYTVPGENGLLGNLLNSVSHLLDPGHSNIGGEQMLARALGGDLVLAAS